MTRFKSLILTAAIFTTTAAYAAPSIGTSAAVRGDVFVTTTGTKRVAKVRDSIRLQDQVLTKDDSALQILLVDRTTFTVGQNANLTITKFIYDPTQDSGELAARVTKGAFRFMSGNIGKANPTNASVSTPSATIGIRGTFFEGIVGIDAIALADLAGLNTVGADQQAASIVILRGPGKSRNTIDRPGSIVISNSGGSRQIAQPGYAVFVASAGATPSAPFKLTMEMQDYLDFFLRSAPNGPPVNPTGLTGTGSQGSGQLDIQIPIDPIDDFVDDGITDPNVPEDVDIVVTPPFTGGP
ncbi:FecR domain-containing protein [Ahrensia sp. R2A130]|uniref:FecR family protein n=1 Tax=Ahrensia sp. R2A130 TaxID=744979 RepID=UPI0001E0C396|nr:FecR domain-containing protein [Ahrensia sp. R2A130]EFL87841.1 RTX toxins and related Ca2+-binding protein [Ahrensia sp. R2A130]